VTLPTRLVYRDVASPRLPFSSSRGNAAICGAEGHPKSDRSAVPHAPARSWYGLPCVQPAGSVDHFAVRAEVLVVRSSLAASRFADRNPGSENHRGRGPRRSDCYGYPAFHGRRNPRHRATYGCGNRDADVFPLHSDFDWPCVSAARRADRVHVEALSLQLTSREQRILRHDVPADPKAYEYYLRGNQFSHDRSSGAQPAICTCDAWRPIRAMRRRGPVWGESTTSWPSTSPREPERG
jgi:hypothetical protein